MGSATILHLRGPLHKSLNSIGAKLPKHSLMRYLLYLFRNEVKEDLLDTSDVIGENFRFHDITDISLDVGRLPGMSVNTSLVT
jgi:hypothetical protein